MRLKIRQAKTDYYATRFDDKRGDPRESWKIVNNILGRNNQQQNIINELKLGNHTVTLSQDIASHFNEYFTSIGPTLAENIESVDCNYKEYINRHDDNFRFKSVNVEKVLKLLSSLSVSKARELTRFLLKF